ncbi:MAG: ArsA-related P-loop ATPase [Thermodesulfobacteriota bacterium]
MHDKPRIIAVCGKGGVGKTSISALIVRELLQDPENKVLAVDADPAVGLAPALGVSAGRTVDDVRNDLIRRVESGKAPGKAEMLAMLDYEMFCALEEKKNLAFLAIGRPEKEGCYCQVNHILKDIIGSMAQSFNFVVIDGEAGIEQVNRRVMENVTHLVLVSDSSARGLNVAKTIQAVSENVISCEHACLVLNRVRGEEELGSIRIPAQIPLLGWIPDDDVVRFADTAGSSLLDISECTATETLRLCLKKIIKSPNQI